MSEQPQEDRLVASARTALDRSTEALSPEIVARLRQARLQALEARPRRSSRLVWAGGLATAAVAILVMVLWWPSAPGPKHHEPSMEDLELLTAPESLDFYEDLEFYRWLADADSSS